MSCTVVSAFYPIKSKFPSQQYIEWGKTFLSISSPLVLFTEPSLSSVFKEMRGDKPMCIIELPFTELETWKLYKEKWIQHYSFDPEKNIHTPELYAVWAQKAFFVEHAIQKNPFNTEFFFWCDFGAFRNPHISKVVLESFPKKDYLSKNKILLQAINDLEDSDKIMRNDGIYGETISNSWNKVRLVGGLWGGGIEACLNWKKSYQHMLEKYFETGRFAGKDQMVMLSTFLENTDLAIVVNCSLQGIDPWFFLEHLLSDEKVQLIFNKSYMVKPVVSVNIMGGLGNQLFQVCTAYSYARKMGGNLQILFKTENGNRPLYFDSVLKKFQKNIVMSLPSTLEMWSEKMATKFSDIGLLSSNGKYLRGYLQSSKYFYNDIIKQEIKQLIRPQDTDLEFLKEKYTYLLNNRERVVVVHCRRTDYLPVADFHGPLNGQYYKQSIDLMLDRVSNPIFLLCGDDNNYWSEISTDIQKTKEFETIIMPSETDINTFYLLQQFENFVMSNSTFIWWCVWLSNSKNVITPAKWFGPTGPKDYEDIYESNWLRI